MMDIIEKLRNLNPYAMNFRDVREAGAAEIEKLRGDVVELTDKLQLMKDESLLFKVNVGLARDLKKAIAERDAALALLRELVETRHNHYIHQTEYVMFRWDERVAAAIDAARGEA